MNAFLLFEIPFWARIDATPLAEYSESGPLVWSIEKKREAIGYSMGGTGHNRTLDEVRYLRIVSAIPAAGATAQNDYVSLVAVQPIAEAGLAEQLRDLAELKAQGVLTDEEFAAAKAKVLSP